MKEYRLLTWPELPPAFDRTAFRRLLSDMSHRHVTVAQMADASGLRRATVADFVDGLVRQGIVEAREVAPPDSLFGSLRPLGGWIRRTFVEGAAAGR
jgi:hypothetical protein